VINLEQTREYTAKEVLNIATTVGFDLLKYGAEVYRVEETISRICEAYGYKDSHIFAIGSNITASVMDGEVTRTETRRIKDRDINLDKIDKLNDLSRKVCAETPDLASVRGYIKEIEKSSMYPLWVMVLCDAVISFCFTLFFGGFFKEAAIAFMAGAAARIIGAVTGKFNKHKYSKIATSSFVIAIIAYACRNSFENIDGDVIIIGAIMTLVPGIAITNALRDFFAGDTVTGLIAFVESILVAISIAIGVAVAMVLAPGETVTTAVSNSVMRDIIQVTTAAIASGGFMVFFNVKGSNVWLGAVLGAISWTVYLAFRGMFSTDIMQYFFAGAALSICAEIFARIKKTPITVYIIAGIIPLVPGSTIYYAMKFFLLGSMADFLDKMVYMIKIGGAIALGIALAHAVFVLAVQIFIYVKESGMENGTR